LFFGRVRIMALALGNAPEREYAPGLYKISQHLHGQVGLFFTSWNTQETLDYFHSVQIPDFARSGNIASREVRLPAGPLSPIVPEGDQADGYKPTPFSASMEPHIRKLGLNTRVEKGVVTMNVAQTVCNKGDTLTTEQAHILKLLGVKLSTFRVALRWRWDKTTGAIEEYDPPLDDLHDDTDIRGDGEDDEQTEGEEDDKMEG